MAIAMTAFGLLLKNTMEPMDRLINSTVKIIDGGRSGGGGGGIFGSSIGSSRSGH